MSDNERLSYELIEGEMPSQFASGIYYLKRGNRVVYIGQSTCIIHRVSCHYVARKKRFDRFAFCNVPFNKLDEYELQEVITYSPEYNKSLPPNDIYASMGMLKARFRKPACEIQKVIKSNNIGSIHLLGRKYYFLREFEGLIKPVKGQS